MANDDQHRYLSWRSVLAFAVLFGGVLFSGIERIEATHETRQLYKNLGDLQKLQNELMAEQSRLLLERSALSNLQTVEVVASENLDMGFPDHFQEVQP